MLQPDDSDTMIGMKEKQERDSVMKRGNAPDETPNGQVCMREGKRKGRPKDDDEKDSSNNTTRSPRPNRAQL